MNFKIELQDLKKLYSFPDFNEIQKTCANVLLNTNENCLVSSPTASGKTVLFEFSLYQTFGTEN